jgi:thiamine-monophosphate kinase
MHTVSSLTESELIGRIRSVLPPAPDWLLVGIGDDAAVLAPERNRLEVLTVDAIVEGVHFDRRFTPPAAIGHRSLAVNLSDLAAMGAAPRLALLSMALPAALPCADFDAIVNGFAALARRFDVHVVGGNLTRSPGPLLIDVTVAGHVKRRQALTRQGARPGDELYVTGAIGGASVGLAMLREATYRADRRAVATRPAGIAAESPCVDRYLFPEPRIRAGLLLARNRAAAACVDLSDGLADGAWRIAEGSGVGVRIEGAAVPVEPDARDWLVSRGDDAVHGAITGGDDYELLFAVRPRLRRRLSAAARHGGVALTRVGACTEDRAVVLVGPDGSRSPMPRGYTHFQ